MPASRRLRPFFLLALIGMVLAPASVWAQQVVLPAFTVKANGVPFGTFLGFSRDLEPIIGLKVAGETNLVPLEFRVLGGFLQFESGCDNQVLYEFANCAGDVYVRAPTTTSGVRTACAMLGKTYAVGPDPGNGGNLTIFKGTGGGSSIMVNSRSIQGGPCTNSSFTGSLVTATAVLDIDSNFPGPYTLE